ncbi:hypothetical protein WR25_01592 [Diploscapter pachys]|uniref:Uncharacterized protein n=1 Tax=Diploscapter pachys TaxID=2018661 RepID=A0A2A2K8G3_9BILA|nr:hypothetical protein WR25_01592 [Diploscapter pachys]
MPAELRVRAAEVRRRSAQHERVRRRRRPLRHPHARIVVAILVIGIFHADREVLAELLFDTAAADDAPLVALAELAEGIGGVGRREFAIDPRIARSERAVEQRRARCVADAAANARFPIQLAGHDVIGGRRRKGADAVGDLALAEFADRTDHDVAALRVHADPPIVRPAIAIVGAAAGRRRRATRAAITEAGREGVGARRGRHRIAEAAVRPAIEQDARTDVVRLDVIAAGSADIDAAERRIVGHLLRLRGGGEGCRGKRAGDQNRTHMSLPTDVTVGQGTSAPTENMRQINQIAQVWLLCTSVEIFEQHASLAQYWYRLRCSLMVPPDGPGFVRFVRYPRQQL